MAVVRAADAYLRRRSVQDLVSEALWVVVSAIVPFGVWWGLSRLPVPGPPPPAPYVSRLTDDDVATIRSMKADTPPTDAQRAAVGKLIDDVR